MLSRLSWLTILVFSNPECHPDSWCLLFALHCSGPAFPVPGSDVRHGYGSQLCCAVLQMPAALFSHPRLRPGSPRR